MLRSFGGVYHFHIQAPSILQGPEGASGMLLWNTVNYLTSKHNVTSHKRWIWINTTVIASNILVIITVTSHLLSDIFHNFCCHAVYHLHLMAVRYPAHIGVKTVFLALLISWLTKNGTRATTLQTWQNKIRLTISSHYLST